MRSAWRQEGGESLGHGRSSVVIEAQPIDERGIFLQAKDARLGVACLSFSRDRAQLSEAEPQSRPRQENLSILIVACG